MDKRYQVFVSSTYVDLQEERQRVIQTLMEMDCIPSGMELFPAADEDQFEFIKKVIDDCDYYILILGGRYGSVDADGVSYTEKEYAYALERKIKVLAFLHENPDSIPFAKSEANETLRERLRVFRGKVGTGRLVNFWKTADQLPGLVSLSLSKTIKTYPAVGWVRGDKTSSEELLSEINELRKEKAYLNEQLSAYVQSRRVEIENLAGLDDKFSFKLGYWASKQRFEKAISMTWREIFTMIAPYLMQHPGDSLVESHIVKALAERFFSKHETLSFLNQDFQTIKIQLCALGLVKVSYSETTNGGMALFWELTQEGEQAMLRFRTQKVQL